MAEKEFEELLSKYESTMPAIAPRVFSRAVCTYHIVLNASVEQRLGAEKKKVADKVVQDKRNEIRNHIMHRCRDVEKHFENRGNKTIQGHYAALIMATLFFTYVVTEKYPKLFEVISTLAKRAQQRTAGSEGREA